MPPTTTVPSGSRSSIASMANMVWWREPGLTEVPQPAVPAAGQGLLYAGTPACS